MMQMNVLNSKYFNALNLNLEKYKYMAWQIKEPCNIIYTVMI